MTLPTYAKRRVPPEARSDPIIESLNVGECPLCEVIMKYEQDKEGNLILVWCPSCGREAKLRDGNRIPYEEDLEEFK